jgi:FkbM family methyltransferase
MDIMSYFKQTEIRRELIDGVGPWVWIKADKGAWIGPKQDWMNSHRDKFYRYLKNRNFVVTAGANQGMYARLYASMFNTVYAFEPDPLNFFCLVNNCQQDNVIKFQAALGETNGVISMSRPQRENTGMNITLPGGMIPMMAIDNLPLTDLSFLQLDTEGAEPFVIRGALKTIEMYKPVIAMENGHKHDSLMNQIGYKIIDQSASDTIYVPRE